MARKSLIETEEKPIQGNPEEDIFIVEFEQPVYDTFSGKKLSKPFSQKFAPRDFAIQIQPDQAGTPMCYTLGYRVNKIIQVPPDKYLENVKVEIPPAKQGQKTTFVPIKEQVEVFKKYVDSQKS